MVNPTSDQKDKAAPAASATTIPVDSPTPLRCFLGALISAAFATPLYFLTSAIATTFANKPIMGNTLAMRISISVRTLVVGLSSLGTMIFAIATLGLLALGIQLLIKQLMSSQSTQ